MIVAAGGVPVPSQLFEDIRRRILPMLQVAADDYRGRAPAGYPVVIDAPEQGTLGLEIDPSYALYVVSEGDDIYADVYRRAPRNDARTSASQMRHSGAPFSDRRPLDATASDQKLRNLVAELMMYYNQQPGLIYISDS